MSEINEARAREIYNNFVNMLVSRDWAFEQFDEDMVIKSAIKGEDLPIQFFIFFMPEKEALQFISVLPFKVAEDMRVDLSIAVNVANYGLLNGSFDYDISDGEIRFRLTQSYKDSQLGDDLFEYMIYCGATTVDKYNDKFLALSKGLITVQDFIDKDSE